MKYMAWANLLHKDNLQQFLREKKARYKDHDTSTNEMKYYKNLQ